MTDAELTALATAARAATPGEWRSHSAAWWMIRTDSKPVADIMDDNPANADWIIQTQPLRILRLIARLRDAEADAARYKFFEARTIEADPEMNADTIRTAIDLAMTGNAP